MLFLLAAYATDTIHVALNNHTQGPAAEQPFVWMDLFKIGSGFAFSLLLWYLTRVYNRKDKQTDVAKAQEKQQADDVHNLKVKAEDNINQHTNFANQLEKIGGELLKAQHLLDETKDRTGRNEAKIDAVKDSLARVEALLTGLLTKDFNNHR